MNTIDISAIVLAIIGMVSGWVSFWLDRRKHRQEVRNLEAQAKAIEADIELKSMNLSKQYVDEFYKNIATPMENRVNVLTKEVDELRKELAYVKKNACYRTDCDARMLGMLD